MTIPCEGEEELPIPQCQSCPFHIQTQEDQLANEACFLYPSNVTNCIQGIEDDIGKCSACKKDWYLKSPTECRQCDDNRRESAGCARCGGDNGNVCLACKEGLRKAWDHCEPDDNKRNSENKLGTDKYAFTFGLERIRVFQDDNTKNEWWDCSAGFRNSKAEYKTQFLNIENEETEDITGKACRIRCGLNQFPIIEKNERGSMRTRSCEDCSSECV